MTLRELVIQLRSVAPHLRTPGNARFGVRHIYEASPSSSTSSRTLYDFKELGTVFARDLQGKEPLKDSGKSKNDPSIKTLEQHRFIPGDFLDIAYLTSSPSFAHHPGAGPANGVIPALQGRMSGLPGSNGLGPRRLNGPTEADQAWGVAGDRIGTSIRGRGAGAGITGANRFNPLISSRGGMSIAGAARRRSPEALNGRLRADEVSNEREDRDGDRNMED